MNQIDPVEKWESYWQFVYCARRALGMGEWEDINETNIYLKKDEPKDEALKKFREEGLVLKKNGFSIKVV